MKQATSSVNQTRLPDFGWRHCASAPATMSLEQSSTKQGRRRLSDLWEKRTLAAPSELCLIGRRVQAAPQCTEACTEAAPAETHCGCCNHQARYCRGADRTGANDPRAHGLQFYLPIRSPSARAARVPAPGVLVPCFGHVATSSGGSLRTIVRTRCSLQWAVMFRARCSSGRGPG